MASIATSIVEKTLTAGVGYVLDTANEEAKMIAEEVERVRKLEANKPYEINYDRRIPGVKIAMWIGFAWLSYQTINYIPSFVDNIDRVLENNDIF